MSELKCRVCGGVFGKTCGCTYSEVTANKPPADSRPKCHNCKSTNLDKYGDCNDCGWTAKDNPPDEDVPLISFEAYAQLERERDQYRAMCKDSEPLFSQRLVPQLEGRIKLLTHERDKYKAALTRIANPLPFNAGDKIACILSIEGFTKIAREALDNGNKD